MNPAESRRIVTIDGPAGCGKSTVARTLAREIGGLAFSSGLVYRAITYLALQEEIDLERSEEVVNILREHLLEIREIDGELRILVDDKDPGDALHSSRVTGEIHWVADDPEVRAVMLPLQRAIRSRRPVVAEGRDMGTVVFPEAAIKIFLTATEEERAHRRLKEFRDKLGEKLEFSRVLEDVRRRDRYDSLRDVSPLRAAEDATTIDTTRLTIDEVLIECRREIPKDWIESPRA